MCRTGHVKLGTSLQRQLSWKSFEFRFEGVELHSAAVTALISASIIAAAAALFAIGTFLGFWACCIGAWLLVELAFYSLQCWRYDTVQQVSLPGMYQFEAQDLVCLADFRYPFNSVSDIHSTYVCGIMSGLLTMHSALMHERGPAGCKNCITTLLTEGPH